MNTSLLLVILLYSKKHYFLQVRCQQVLTAEVSLTIDAGQYTDSMTTFSRVFYLAFVIEGAD